MTRSAERVETRLRRAAVTVEGGDIDVQPPPGSPAAAARPLARRSCVGPSAATAPTSATIAGDLQSELGCPGDWAPDCAATDLTPTDGVFVRSFTVPTGNWQYKVALNHSWDESYGGHTGGDNISLAGTAAA